MSYKTINKILSVLFLTDYAIGLSLIISILFVWSPLTDVFTWTRLFLFISKLAIHILLGLSAILVLFFNRIKAIYFLLPLYVSEIFLSKYWQINPDAPKTQEMIETYKQAMEAAKEFPSNVNVTVHHPLHYPPSFVHGFYVVSIIYIFFIMPKLRKKAEN
jgi:hypothetical protein